MSEKNVCTSKRVILDFGRQKRKAIKELKKGTGQLADEVHEAAAQAVAAEKETDGKEVVAVLIVYRKRARKRRGLLGEIPRRR